MKNVIIRGKRKQKLILSISVELSYRRRRRPSKVPCKKMSKHLHSTLQLAVDVAYFLVHLQHHISLT